MKSQHLRPSADERKVLENNLYAAVLALKTPTECRNFFRDLTTPAELEALTDRWAVVGLLEEGIPYREIHDRTGVSVTTIGRVARFLTHGNGGYDVAYRRLSRNRGSKAK